MNEDAAVRTHAPLRLLHFGPASGRCVTLLRLRLRLRMCLVSGRVLNHCGSMYAQKLGTNGYFDAYLTELRPYLKLRSPESKIMTQSPVGVKERRRRRSFGLAQKAFERGL